MERRKDSKPPPTIATLLGAPATTREHAAATNPPRHPRKPRRSTSAHRAYRTRTREPSFFSPLATYFERRRHQRSSHVGLKRSEEHTSELQSRGHLVCRL